MVESISGIPEQAVVIDAKEISRRERNFRRVLRHLTPEQQGVVTELTSILMESDIYALYRGNLEKVESLSDSLGSIGLKTKQRKTVLRYLNLG